MNKLKINYKKQCKPKFLKNGRGQQSLDFYLLDYKIAIECQGEQHFKAIDFAGKGEEWMNKLFEKKKNDNRKLKKCLANDIKMIYLVDNDGYRNSKYHFDIVEPFSGNVSYKVIHINHFENHINLLGELAHLFGLEMVNNFD